MTNGVRLFLTLFYQRRHLHRQSGIIIGLPCTLYCTVALSIHQKPKSFTPYVSISTAGSRNYKKISRNYERRSRKITTSGSPLSFIVHNNVAGWTSVKMERNRQILSCGSIDHQWNIIATQITLLAKCSNLENQLQPCFYPNESLANGELHWLLWAFGFQPWVAKCKTENWVWVNV